LGYRGFTYPEHHHDAWDQMVQKSTGKRICQKIKITHMDFQSKFKWLVKKNKYKTKNYEYIISE
jgi:hypothetical protein